MVNGGVLRCGPNSCMPHGSATGFKTINAHVHGLGRKQLRPEPLAICHARSPIDELDLENREPMQNPKSSVPGSLGYSFTPGGLLVPYYIGVMRGMENLGLIGQDTPISGSSAGAIVAALIASGLDHKDCLEANKRLQLEILQNGTFQKLCGPLRNSMMDVLPENVHLRASGRIGIAVTVYRPWGSGNPMEGRLLDEYSSKEDFVDAVVASCYIPYYLGPAPGIRYRGELCSDGLPTNFFPEIVDSAKDKVQKTVMVSAMPRTNRLFMNGPGVDISPDNRPRSQRFSYWGYVQRGVSAYPLDDLELLESHGYEDASNWGELHLRQKIQESSGVLK